ncbi:MAG: hypothetical protein HYU88_06455 [Chloroflexi bacterium]|nr:hypothetical protein [Chloroflexota bacterium]
MREIAEAQRRTDEQLVALTEAQRRTDEQLVALTEAQRRTQAYAETIASDLGRLSAVVCATVEVEAASVLRAVL